MERHETAEIVEIIYYTYPNWLRVDFGTEKLEKLIDVWHGTLGEYNGAMIRNNLTKHINESKYAPAISDLTEGKDPRDGKAHPDGGAWYNGKQLLGAIPWN